MDEEEEAVRDNNPAVEAGSAEEGNEMERGADMDSPGTPGTYPVQPRGKDDKPAKVYKTIHLSSSSKARARIRTCDKCGHDNIPEARFCEGCGDNLDEQAQKQDLEKSIKRLEEYSERAAKVRAKKGGRTILRKYKTPMMQPPVDIEKKSYHSHYIPPGTPVVQQFDPTAFRSDQGLDDHQRSKSQLYPPQGYSPQEMQQYLAVPVNYALQVAPKKRSTSFIVGIVLLSVLVLVLIGLIVTIIVLAV